MRYLTLLLLIFTSVLSGQKAGILDSTYGVNGIWKNAIEGPMVDNKFSIAILENNKKLISGFKMINSKAHTLIMRLNPDGDIDSTFGDDGEATYEFERNAVLADIKVQNNSKIIVSGALVQNSLNRSDALIMRYTPDGKLDTTFNQKGYLIQSYLSGLSSSSLNRIIIKNDGNLMFGGWVSGISNSFLAIVQLTKDGRLDSTFGDKGITFIQFGKEGFNCNFTDMVTLSDGKILCVGIIFDQMNRRHLGLSRININGFVDSTFGYNGIILYDFVDRFEDFSANTIEISDENIMAGLVIIEKKQTGDKETKLAIFKFNRDGLPIIEFGVNGIRKYNLGSSYYSRDAIIRKIDESNLILCGTTVKNIDSMSKEFFYRITKLDNEGNPDYSFGIGGNILTPVPQYVCPQSIGIEKKKKIMVLGASSNTLGYPVEFYIYTARYHSVINIGMLDFKFTESEIINYPNPVKKYTTLEYTLKGPEKISIYLTDITGRMIKVYKNKEMQSAGEQKVVLDFVADILPGTYLLCVSNGKSRQNIKINKTD